MKTLIDVDEEAMAAAAAELGTTTKKDTVNEALKLVAERGRRARMVMEGTLRFGVGADINVAEVMREARR